MANNVLMPKMGYDMEEGKILRWLKNEGEQVTKGEPIAEIETDKIAIEIEAFASGVLTKILVQAGEMAPVGDAIGVIGEPGEKAAAPAAKKAEARAEAPKAEAKAEAPKAEAKAEAPQPDAKAEKAAPAPKQDGERFKSSPLARKVADDLGVDIKGLEGTGPGGRVVKKDVEAAAGAAPKAAAAPTAAAPTGGGKKVPLSAMRKAIARRMVESKAPVPHFYVTMAVDMDAAMKLRTQINEGLEKDAKISVNDMIIKACALGLRKYPSLNAVFAGDGIIQPDEIAISVAVAIDDGLIAPDIHRADEKSIGTIAREVKDKARRAKDGKLTPDEYGRGTFTVSNLGMFGVEEFTAIITLPQSAAVAVGAVLAVPVVKGGVVVPGQVMRFTVSADHRVTDGAGSAQFAAEVKRLLENPMQLLI
ncbi:MAG: 2-oxo acid dehydrogenase subunit [Cyanobacteria bacterium RYN_339]|nr:2-oxo acid dehydrogenase subunit [Cyanobacteria bacterium RYN_339]